MRKLASFATLCLLFLMVRTAHAQQGDIAIGFGTMMSSGSSSCTGFTTSCLLPEKGGLYPSINGDVIFHKRVGFNFETAWRAKQGDYLGQPFRPILVDFNAIYQPRISRKVGIDLLGGVGFQTTRFYGFTNTTSCIDFNACYNSSNHFLVDVGGGIRYYVRGHIFVRPEIRFYHIVNNTADFTNNNVFRVGASIGYTIGPD